MEQDETDWSHARLHAIYAIANAPVRPYPFPHIFVGDVFPAAFYDCLLRHLPPDRCFLPLVETGLVGPAYSRNRLVVLPAPDHLDRLPEADRAFWSATFHSVFDAELSRALIDKFAPVIASRFALDSGPEARIVSRVNVSLTRDLAAYELGPHTDTPSKLVSMIVYLPPDDRRPQLGTSLYLPRDRGFTCEGRRHHPFGPFERVTTLPYRPNAVLAFPKTSTSFHGVEPLADACGPRDTIQFNLWRVRPIGAEAR